jgi:hypothetical protein
MVNIDEIQNWWLTIPEERRIEIYKKRNSDCVDIYNNSDWSSWWYYLSNKEQEKVYKENKC